MKTTSAGVMQLRTVLTVGLILFISFSLGYRGGEFSQFLRSFRNQPVTVAVPESAQPLPVAEAPAPPVPQFPVQVAARPMPSVVPAPMNPPPQNNSPSFIYPNAQPSVQPSAGPGTLVNTLESMQSGEMSDELKRQRNVYFDRLQQQLAEMRQAQPPAQVDAVNPGSNEGTPPAPQNDENTGAPPQAFPIPPPPPGFGQPTGLAANSYPEQQDDGEPEASNDADEGDQQISDEESTDEEG